MAEGASLSIEAIQERALYFTRDCPGIQEKEMNKGWSNGTRDNVSPAQLCESPQRDLVAGSVPSSYDIQLKKKGACLPAIGPPTSYQALQALRMVIKYAEPRLELPQDANFLIQLGRVEERLEKYQRDFTDVCVQAGLHGMDRE